MTPKNIQTNAGIDSELFGRRSRTMPTLHIVHVYNCGHYRKWIGIAAWQTGCVHVLTVTHVTELKFCKNWSINRSHSKCTVAFNSYLCYIHEYSKSLSNMNIKFHFISPLSVRSVHMSRIVVNHFSTEMALMTN